jgi:CrcB protein
MDIEKLRWQFSIRDFICNVAGGFFIGFILQGSNMFWNLSDGTRTFLTTGILGGLTTFSTFSYETFSMFGQGKYLTAGINIALNIILSIAGVWAGKTAVIHIY